jgi:hypothetical protein
LRAVTAKRPAAINSPFGSWQPVRALRN